MTHNEAIAAIERLINQFEQLSKLNIMAPGWLAIIDNAKTALKTLQGSGIGSSLDLEAISKKADRLIDGETKEDYLQWAAKDKAGRAQYHNALTPEEQEEQNKIQASAQLTSTHQAGKPFEVDAAKPNTMNKLNWTTTKPVFDDDSKPCLLLCKNGFGYHLFEVRHEYGEDLEGNQGHYWALYLDGEEHDEYEELVAERYALIEYCKT